MSYIDSINRFWKVHEAYSFSVVEIGLYFKLLDIANKMRWEKEKLYIPMIRLQTEMDACKSSILKARKRLEEADLIVLFNPVMGIVKRRGIRLLGLRISFKKTGFK